MGFLNKRAVVIEAMRLRFQRRRDVAVLVISALALVISQTGSALAEEPRFQDPSALLDAKIDHYRKQLKKDADHSRARFQLARFLHLKGARGDEAAAKEALRRLKKLHADRPDDPVVTAYLGGAVMLSAKRQFWPWSKQDKLEKARKLLNQAVKQASDKYQPRLLRGIATSHLPEKLGQREKARGDLKWAVRQAGDRQSDDTIDASDAAAAHYHLGRLLTQTKEKSKALHHWRRAAKLAPNTYAGLRARKAIEKRRGD